MTTATAAVACENVVSIPTNTSNIEIDFARGAYTAIVDVIDNLHNPVLMQRGVAVPIARRSEEQLGLLIAIIELRLRIKIAPGSYMYMHPLSNNQRTYLITRSEDVNRFMKLYPRQGSVKIILPAGAQLPAADDYEA